MDNKQVLRKRLEENSVKVPEAGCWLWLRAITNRGYGRISVGGNKQDYAHRVALQVFSDVDVSRWHVLHRCDTRSCVNPNHLFVGTAKDNVVDMMEKRRRTYKITPEDADVIRNNKSPTKKRAAIAKEYGISVSQVGRIINKQRWAT